jgi:hypothetical protein
MCSKKGQQMRKFLTKIRHCPKASLGKILSQSFCVYVTPKWNILHSFLRVRDIKKSKPFPVCFFIYNIAQNMKRSRNKLHQGLDISVRSTDNNKLRLQWDWTPSITNSGFRVWYSVLALGTKFAPSINSHKR